MYHPRYTLPPMLELWSERNKFDKWLKVELAFLEARVEAGTLSREHFEQIRAVAGFNIVRIAQIEAETDHDLIAFVRSVQEHISQAGFSHLAKELHEPLTSYDTEDCATILILRDAV